MEVVIYARYSSKKQNETSIEAQLKECYEFCRKNNYIVIGEYIDEALTGKNDNRLQFQKMMKDSWQKKFQGIIVYKLDRFARNRYDSAIYKSKLKKNGVRGYSAIENIGDDASGILMESVLEGMAEYYSAELAQKVNRNMMLNAEKGYFNGGKVPFGFDLETIQFNGYKKRKLIINKDLQPIVRKIFEMKSVNTKDVDIIDYLKSNGIRNNNGKEFNKCSLQNMFSNKRCIGTTTYNDKEYSNTIPKMIEEELFYKVQEVRKRNKHLSAKNKAKEEYILTSKLFCAECKVLMTGCSGTSKTGVVYSYYVCNNRKKGQCQKKYISKHIIEEVVIKICLELLTKKILTKFLR